MGMFDRYINLEGTSAHSNLFRFPPCEDLDTIVVGGTSTIAFEMPFKYTKEDVQSITVIFKQEERLLLSITDLEITPHEHHDCFTLECTLKPEQTRLFGNTLLDTFVQVRVEYKDTVFFTEKYKLKVINTLEEN